MEDDLQDPEQQTLPLKFGNFYLFDLIGKGGMAEVFLAKSYTSIGVERLCAIKRILPFLSADGNFSNLFIQEAKLAAKLRNANIVQVLDLGRIDDQLYIAMEYVEGFDLNELLGLCTRHKVMLPFEFAFFIIRETLRSLDYAHRSSDDDGSLLGVIHMDLSPSNVLISTEGEIKLCDFGIARAVLSEEESASCPEEAIQGKFAYMSPEQVRGHEVDQRSDVFSAGILLWELLSGKRLYKCSDMDETYAKAMKAEIPELANRSIPEFDKTRDIVNRALEVNPDDRFQSAYEFLREIDDYIHQARMLPSQMRFADFLMDNFGDDLIAKRRERERALARVIPEAGEEPPDTEDSVTEVEPVESTGAEKKKDTELSAEDAIRDLNRKLSIYAGIGASMLLTIIALIIIIYFTN